MQWNPKEFERWEELRQFVDTALLPLYLFRPDLEMADHVLRMNYLLNVAAGIERRLRGRVLLFPLLYHFSNEWNTEVMPPGFAHRVLLCFAGDRIHLPQSGERLLVLTVGEEDLDSSLRFDVTVDVLYKEVIRQWQQEQKARADLSIEKPVSGNT